VNDELERTRKDFVVAYLKLLFQYVSGRTEKFHGIFQSEYLVYASILEPGYSENNAGLKTTQPRYSVKCERN
jgi:hypothetical protein